MKHDIRSSAELRAAVRLNEAKIEALRAYGDRFQQALLTMAEDLARQGATKTQILDAVDALRPAFDDGAKTTLRAVTIEAMLTEASNG